MGKMYTLKPDESINDHVKDSMSIINHIVELSIGCMRDLANPHEGTFVDMTFNKFMRLLEHIRDSIQMLDELCDELEDDKDEIRHEYEEKVIQFFNRFMNADLNDETNYRLGECVRHIHEIENHYMKEIQKLTEDFNHFRDLAISRNKELEEERERSNQLEKELSRLKAQYGEIHKELEEERECSNQLEEKYRKAKTQYELAKKFLHQRRAEISRLKEDLEEERDHSNQLGKRCTELIRDRDNVVDHWTKYCEDLLQKHREELALKDHEIWELEEQEEYWEDLAKKYADPDGHKPNNPANFCGNCKYFTMHSNDVGICNNKHADPFIVDPDDASCQAFESNNPTVVVDKPEFPCCDHCNHEDCDDCTLCPF